MANFPWFLWKGVDSREMGIWVSELPQPTRAPERTQHVNVIGRAGALTIKEADDVHDGYTKNCRITVRADADFESILTWLSGDGEVVFSNEPNRVYYAHLAAEVAFTRDGNSMKISTIPFYVHPHKGQYPPEGVLTLTSGGRIYNPGTVAARPLITIESDGDVALTIGEQTQTFESIPDEIRVDCDAELITDGDGVIWLGQCSTPFLSVPPGYSDVSWTGTATITMKPRWRWF